MSGESLIAASSRDISVSTQNDSPTDYGFKKKKKKESKKIYKDLKKRCEEKSEEISVELITH